MRGRAHAAVLVGGRATAPAVAGGGAVGEGTKAAEVSGLRVEGLLGACENGATPEILPAECRKMEKVGGDTGG